MAGGQVFKNTGTSVSRKQQILKPVFRRRIITSLPPRDFTEHFEEACNAAGGPQRGF